MQPLFITGIGTNVGKTVVAAIIAEALKADYWKPIQAGYENGTDTLDVLSLISNSTTIVHPEVYQLSLPASPHIAAKNENVEINLNQIINYLPKTSNSNLVIEGAGGILVPINETEFIADLIKLLHAKVILISRNYLGSINHSLLTAAFCKQNNINVLGWVFNDTFMNYEDEIVAWSGYPKIATIPNADCINKDFINKQALQMKSSLSKFLC